MSQHRAVLLDFDGTLADSLESLRTVYARFLRLFGRSGNDDEFSSLNGPSLAEIVIILRDTHSLPGDSDDLLSLYSSMVSTIYEEVPPNPGARELLEAAKATGWSIGVVTSNNEATTRRWLDDNSLISFVDCVVAATTMLRGKPHPDLYQAALSEVSAAANASVAVEDSRMGATAAVAAGIATYLFDPSGKGLNGRPLDWPPLAGSITRLDDLVDVLR